MAGPLPPNASRADFLRTSAYANSVIFPPYNVPMRTLPPAWAKHRNDLFESLDFFKSRRGNVYIHNGVVLGFLIDGDSGERTYLDSEVVIAKFASSAELRRGTRPSLDAIHSDVKLQAWQHTKNLGASVVVIAAKSYPNFTIQLSEDYRYVVLENFRITDIWAERDRQNGISYMAKLEKCNLLARSWWTPNQVRPPARRDQQFRQDGFHFLPPTSCQSCAQESPRVYSKAWICLNRQCDFFFTCNDAMRTNAPARLTFHQNFLGRRTFATPEQEHFKPAYALAPDLVGSLGPIQGSGQIVAQLSMLWKGVVCSQCHALVPKIYWDRWSCTECDGGFDMYFNPGLINLRAVVPRPLVSFVGHPPVEAKWPAEDVQHQGPIFKEHYRVDKWILHGGSRLILISPTASFNEEYNGPNTVFKDLLNDANEGELDLHRNQMSTIAENLSQHFEANYGEPYSFSDHPTIPFNDAKQSVRLAAQIVDQTCREELRSQYSAANSIQVMGYLEGMSLPWHTDGTDELGATIATLNLGCDATFRLRLQQQYYNNVDVFNPKNQVITGAKSWRRVAHIKTMLDAGRRLDPSVAFSTVQGTAEQQNTARPEIELPLIHGSIIIMQGAAIGKYYEHCVDLKGGLRFEVTLRQVDQQLRQQLYDQESERDRERTTGQIFTHDDEETVDDQPDSEESPVLRRAELGIVPSRDNTMNGGDEDATDVDGRTSRSYRERSPLGLGRHRSPSSNTTRQRAISPTSSSQDSTNALRRSTRTPKLPPRLAGEGYYDPHPSVSDDHFGDPTSHEDANQVSQPSPLSTELKRKLGRRSTTPRSRNRPQQSLRESRSRSPRRESMPPPPRPLRARTATPVRAILPAIAAAPIGYQIARRVEPAEPETVGSQTSSRVNVHWTREEAAEVLRLRDGGSSYEEIARQIGTGRSAGSCRRAALIERRRRIQEGLVGGEGVNDDDDNDDDDNDDDDDNNADNTDQNMDQMQMTPAPAPARARARATRSSTPATATHPPGRRRATTTMATTDNPITNSTLPVPPTHYPFINTITTSTGPTTTTPTLRNSHMPTAWLSWEIETLGRMRNEENASFEAIADALTNASANISRGITRSNDNCRLAWGRFTRSEAVQNTNLGYRRGRRGRVASAATVGGAGDGTGAAEGNEDGDGDGNEVGAAASTTPESVGRITATATATATATWEQWELDMMARLREQNASWDQIKNVLNDDPRNTARGVLRSHDTARSMFSKAVRKGKVNFKGEMGNMGKAKSAEPDGGPDEIAFPKMRRRDPDDDSGSGSGRTASMGLNSTFDQLQLGSQGTTTRSRGK